VNGTPARADSNRTLFAALVATVTMLFLAFTAAYLERRATMAEWPRLRLPPLLWVNTAILAGSSVLLAGRRMTPAIGLGFLFLALQVLLFRRLAADGVYLPTHPHSSFFYVLTAVHGVHVVAGLIALLVARVRPSIRGLCAAFWHFLGAVWLYVLLVLQLL
jgi:cytochrome c oxidase subunit 3